MSEKTLLRRTFKNTNPFSPLYLASATLQRIRSVNIMPIA